MPLSDIVDVEISAESVGVTQQGFGVPLVLSFTAAWTERVRFYTGIGGVSDDFDSDEPEYLMAAKIFAQSPKPPRIAIGRCANKPTQRRTVTPVAADDTDYTIRVGANTFTHNSGSAATATTIVTGLKALINAETDNLLATGTATLVLTATAAGLYDDVEVADPRLLGLAQDHDDVAGGIGAELDAIFLEDSSWYLVLNPFNSIAMVEAIAFWTEANKRLFVYATQDGECATHALSGATDVMAALKGSAYARTAGIYHPSNGAFADAAWAGRCLPLDPGSETWAHKTLATVAATRLTDTWRTNVLAKKGSVYETVAGRNITEFGTVASGEYIDVVRFVDWLTARIGERVFGTLSNSTTSKIPYTDRGIAVIAGDVRAVLKDGVAAGGLAEGTVAVSVPKAADADPADKAARVLRNLNFTATLAGAVHTAVIRGTVTV